jgi:hypothetical protein
MVLVWEGGGPGGNDGGRSTPRASARAEPCRAAALRARRADAWRAVPAPRGQWSRRYAPTGTGTARQAADDSGRPCSRPSVSPGRGVTTATRGTTTVQFRQNKPRGRTGMLARPLAGAARPLQVYRHDADDKVLEGDRGLGLVAFAV